MFVACFYAALLVFIAAGVVVLSRRTQRRRAPVAPIAVAFEPAIAVEHKREPEPAAQPVDAKLRSAQDLRALVAMLHQRELAAEHRALSGKVDAVVVDLPAVEAEELAWQARRAVVAEMHEREVAAEHRAFAREH